MILQFKEEVEKGDSQFCLPYKMEKDKIEDTSNGQAFSIKYVHSSWHEISTRPITLISAFGCRMSGNFEICNVCVFLP